MKTRLWFLLALLALHVFAQAHSSDKDKVVKYNFLLNEVPEDFDMPMIGLINTAHGNQYFFQLGLVNTNERNLEGAQIGFINNVGRDLKGLQIGFINTIDHDQIGVQAGFINAVDNNFRGLEMGFINAIGDRIQGIQAGFINAVEKMDGFQIGFINATENLNGFQVGFINAAERANGAQVGFLNANEVLDGFQLGFINRAERIKNGTPVGFLTFVKRGGYKALDLSINELFPFNLSFKTGVRKFYTYPILSFNPEKSNHWGFGYGIGSFVNMNEDLFFNPELSTELVLNPDFDYLRCLVLNFGGSISDHIEVFTGPSLVWYFSSSNHPTYALRRWELNMNKELFIGFRASLRYRF